MTFVISSKNPITTDVLLEVLFSQAFLTRRTLAKKCARLTDGEVNDLKMMRMNLFDDVHRDRVKAP